MKRMIDNKEFDKIKNDVSELKEEIENIEGIPTITIDVSQMISANEVQLTDEQYEILTNNAFVNVVTPTGENIGFNIMQNESTIILSNCIGSSGEITYYRGLCIKATKIVTLTIGDFSGGGKQLYQHNIQIRHTTNDNIVLYIEITNDSQASFDFNSLKTWLTGKFTNIHFYKATGNWIQDTTSTYYDIVGIGMLSTNIVLNSISTDRTTCNVVTLYNTNLNFEDEVIAL